MIKAFIFDMDGVIIDSEPIHFDVDLMTLNHFGLSLPKERLEHYVGMTNPEMWGLIKREYGLTNALEEIITFQLSRKLSYLDEFTTEPILGVRDLIQELSDNNIQIGLASSSPRVFIEGVLSKFNILEKFNCIVSGEEVDKGKPAPDVYLEAARLLNVRPEDCYVIEDSRNGVLAAKRAGMRCFGFSNPNSGNQDLSAADIIIKAIRDVNIKELLEQP